MKRAIPIVIIAAAVFALMAAIFYHSSDKESDQIAAMMPKERGLQLMVADTEEKRRKGLSTVDSLPADVGMVFVFERIQKQCMWNKGVKFPIDVAFFDEKWGIINAARMEAGSSKRACSVAPSKYVVEANVGTFVKGNR